jgi:putative ABC transport system substrate-binding protein
MLLSRHTRRREFITLLGGTAAAWPLAAGAQETAMPVVAFVTPSERDSPPSLCSRVPQRSERYRGRPLVPASDTGYIEGQNVSVEYHWLEGRYDRLPALMADLVRRQVAVIATPGGSFTALAAKAATATIPIVFGVAENPVSIGLVANLARPGGNATGINFFLGEVVAKRLGLLRELVPKAVRLGVLVNPANGLTAEATLRDIPEAARTLGLQVQVLKASTGTEIDAGFSAMVRDRADALFIAPDAFFVSRRVQFATLAARDRVPTSCANREMVEAGLLMSYGVNIADMFLQVGIYTGDILKGTKPADLPVLQSTKFEFVINLQTATALGIEVPLPVQQLADEVIE